jgi:hypothetical protein
VSVAGREVVRSSSPDAAGDALSSYSVTFPGAAPPPPPTTNEPAGDFIGVSIGPDAATGGFTVTMHVADLSSAALTRALADTGAQSLLWLWRFGNGYQPAAASARWSPLGGFTFGFNGYTLGGSPCDSAVSGEKCEVYPGDQPLMGSVDQTAGTITLVVPASYLKQLAGTDADGRPLEAAATAGARFYDGTAFSLANNVSATQGHQTFLYPLDNTPAMDFLLPAAATSHGGGSGGGGGGGGGGGAPAPAAPSGTGETAPAPAAPATPVPAGVAGTKKKLVHAVTGSGTVRAAAHAGRATFRLDNRHVTYTDPKSHLTFRSTKVTSVRFGAHSATLRGVGVRNGKRGVPFRVVAVDGRPDTVHAWFGRYALNGIVVRGSVTVR